MKYPQVSYMWQPESAEWLQMLNEWPRENLEKLIYDLAFSSGVLSGLEITQQPTPNLTILVKKGRACYLDTATAKARVIEVAADTTVNMTSYLPVGSPSTVLVVVEPKTLTALTENVVNAPPTLVVGVPHPDYDAAFSGSSFDRLQYDDADIRVVGVATGQQVIIGSVTLSAGQTVVLNSHLKTDLRQLASPNPKVLALEARLAAIEPLVSPIGSITQWAGDISQIPVGWHLCDGSALSRTTYAKLFNLLQVNFGNGDGINSFNIPDLRDRFVISAGNAYGRGQEGGNEFVTLTQNQLPNHNHAATLGAGGAHTHTATTNNGGAHGHYLRGDNNSGGSNNFAPQLIEASSWNNYAGGPGLPTHGSTPADSNPVLAAGANFAAIPADGTEHNHPITVAGVNDHTHSLSLQAVGGGQAVDIRPKFVGLFSIIRIS